jgi:CRISPR-associated protein Csh2
MANIKNRSEILFLYDITDANPNGDPVDENKPRLDEEEKVNIVTDVRLKRTIRDYLNYYKKIEIFVREIELDDGTIQDAKTRAEDFLYENGVKLNKNKLSLQQMKQIITNNILSDCIDVRLFGGTIPIEKSQKEKSSITFTGPVQFKYGRSLHRVKLQFVKGTGAFASGAGSTQKTFREEYILPYSLITFYGVINENAAKETNLQEEDKDLLLEGIWNGTKNLISRSKIGQMPRLLLEVVYKEKNFHMGELDKRIRFVSDKNDEEIRDIKDGRLDITELIKALELHKDAIERINYKADERLTLILEGKEICLKEALSGFNAFELSF